MLNPLDRASVPTILVVIGLAVENDSMSDERVHRPVRWSMQPPAAHC